MNLMRTVKEQSAPSHARARLRYLACWLVVFSVSVALTSEVNAQDQVASPAAESDHISRAFEFGPADTGWGTYFDYQVDAGATHIMAFHLVNVGEVDQEFRVYSVNAGTAPGGGFEAADYGTQKTLSRPGWNLARISFHLVLEKASIRHLRFRSHLTRLPVSTSRQLPRNKRNRAMWKAVPTSASPSACGT